MRTGARLAGAFATSVPQKRHEGIAAFIVDRDTPAQRVGKHEDKLGPARR
jgi:acyl-CoA dehydrogenase